MDVRLPDGRLLKNVPEGTTKAQIAAKAGLSTEPKMGKGEALSRGAYYGGWQQPRDVAAAGVAKVLGGVPFKEGLADAKEMSLEGKQGQAQQDRPGWFTGGQLAGNIATTMLPAMGATKAIGAAAPALASVPVVGNTLSKAAVATGASSGLFGVPASGAVQGTVMSGMTEGDASGAIPGALGASVAAGVGKLFRPIDKISAARQGYTKELQNIGIDDLSPGQLTGNKNLELVDSVLNEMLPTAGAARKKAEGQLTKFTQAAMKKAGISADDFSPEVRAAAEEAFTNKYGQLINNETIYIDKPVLEAISKVESKTLNKLPTNVKPVIQSYISDIIGSGGKMNGAAYQETRSQMSQQARAMSTNDPFTANALRSIRNALDGAAERSLPEAKKGAWSELNNQYRNYKTLTKAASMVSKDSLEGLIPPSALNRAVETANKTKSQAGYGDLYGLGRAGRAVLSDSVPNSGTAQRQLAQQLLTMGVGGSAVGSGTYAATHDPYASVAAGLGGAIAAPKLAQILLNTPAAQQYFTQGVPFLNKPVGSYEKLLAAQLSAGRQ